METLRYGAKTSNHFQTRFMVSREASYASDCAAIENACCWEKDELARNGEGMGS